VQLKSLTNETEENDKRKCWVLKSWNTLMKWDLKRSENGEERGPIW